MNQDHITFDLTVLTKKEVWLSKKSELLTESKSIAEVGNQDQLDESGAIQAKIGKHIKELSKERLELTRQIDAVKKTVMEHEKNLIRDLETEHDRLKVLNSAYATIVMRRQEEERRRAARAEQEEAERIIAEAEKKRAESERIKALFGEETEVSYTPEPEISFAPPPKVEKLQTQAVSFIETWNFEIVDLSLIPREFLIPDEKRIRQFVTYNKQDAVIPGVKIFKTVNTRTK